MQRRIEEYKEQERQRSGKKIVDLSKFLFVDEDKSGSHSVPGYLFHEGTESEHKSMPIEEWEKDVGIPIRQKDGRPTPKKKSLMKKEETDSDYVTDEFGNRFPKYEEKEHNPQ